MIDLKEGFDRIASGVYAGRDSLKRVLHRAERRRTRRRITTAVLALVIAGAGSVGAYLGIAGGVRAPAANSPSPTTSPFGQKTVTVDGVPFTISGSSSPEGPCIGVSAPGGTIGGGCGRSEGPFHWGEGGLRADGQLYNIAYGEAPPGASQMEVVLGDGSTSTADTTYGLWLFVVPATEGDPGNDFTTVKAEDETGNVLAQVDLPSLAAERRQAQEQAQLADQRGNFDVTYVPAGFASCEKIVDTLPASPGASHAGPSTITIRIQKFSNVPGCSGPLPKEAATFDVETVVGAPIDLEQELAQNPDGRRVEVNGRKAVLLPRNRSRGLIIVEWMVSDIKVSVIGKAAIQAPGLLAIAEGVEVR
jgi:hypothetical protein